MVYLIQLVEDRGSRIESYTDLVGHSAQENPLQMKRLSNTLVDPHLAERFQNQEHLSSFYPLPPSNSKLNKRKPDPFDRVLLIESMDKKA